MWHCLYYQEKNQKTEKNIYKAVVTLRHIHATAYDATVKMNEAGLMHLRGKNAQDIVFWTKIKYFGLH